jgi:hypothetical protein
MDNRSKEQDDCVLYGSPVLGQLVCDTYDYEYRVPTRTRTYVVGTHQKIKFPWAYSCTLLY